MVGGEAVWYRRTLRMDPDRRRLHAAGVPIGSALGRCRWTHYRTVQLGRPEEAMPQAAVIERPATLKAIVRDLPEAAGQDLDGR